MFLYKTNENYTDFFPQFIKYISFFCLGIYRVTGNKPEALPATSLGKGKGEKVSDEIKLSDRLINVLPLKR